MSLKCDCRSSASSVCRRLGEVAYQLRERLLKSHGSVHVRSPILHN